MLSSATFCHNFIIVAFLITSKYCSRRSSLPRPILRSDSSFECSCYIFQIKTNAKYRWFFPQNNFPAFFRAPQVPLGFLPCPISPPGKSTHRPYIGTNAKKLLRILRIQRKCKTANECMTTNYQDLSVFAECSSLHLSLSRSNIPVGGDLPLKLWGDLLSVCLVPLSHICTAPAQRIIYIWNICSIFFCTTIPSPTIALPMTIALVFVGGLLEC